MIKIGNLEGLIPLAAGVYVLLVARGVLPRKPRHPERLERWRQRYGKLATVLCVVVIVFGAMQLLGVFNRS
ncbi:MAG: hypothetical protein HY721_18160 [Planctomycetes bacterium]|nr:hypothetical protein [Planctomycetota bacterium]